MPVVSVKVDEETKKEMMRYRERFNWPEEIRKFIEESVAKAKREENLKKVKELLSGIPGAPAGSASKLVREDRDSGH